MFGLFGKKEYPVLKSEMITPSDKLITTALAKQTYKKYMAQIAFLKKDELSENVDDLSEEMINQTEWLRDSCSDAKEDISEAKKELKDLKKKLSSCTAEEKEDVEEDINNAEENLKSCTETLEETSRKLAAFKEDKRAFLVEYINSQVHNYDPKYLES